MTRRRRNHFPLAELFAENKLVLGMIACLMLAGGNYLYGGGGAKLNQMFALQAHDEALASLKDRTKASQKAAEEIFAKNDCSSQFLNAATRSNGLTEGATAIDPVTGSPFGGGFLCTPDGGLWQVSPGGVVRLIGASPVIRRIFVKGGSTDATRQMEKAHQQPAGSTPRTTGFLVNP